MAAIHQSQPFADQLRHYRRERRLTQEELAERARLSARGIRALESGERTNPHRDTVRLLAEALELTQEQRATLEEAALNGPPAGPECPPPSGGFLGASPAGALVGREAEMRRLLMMIDDAVQGTGRVVMLAGEPGIGKTRIAQEVTVLLGTKGFLVATGQCYEPEQTVPYYPFLDALTTATAAAPPSVRAEIPRRWPHLERLLPDRAVRHTDGQIIGHDVQQVLFWAVSGFLKALAADAPVALLLDDLHWADESTLKLFHHLARRLHADRVLLLGTYRDADIEERHPLLRTLRDLHRDGLLEEVTVRSLNRQSTGALAGAILGENDVPDEFADRLYQHTDGNPFFIQEVVRGLVERGAVFCGNGSWDPQVLEEVEIPRSIRLVVGERLSRLGEVPRGILRDASVLGQAFDFGDLQAMGDRGEEEVEATIKAATGAGLVRVLGNDGYAFSHALVRQVLHDELSPWARKRLHRAAGEALERLPEPDRQKRAMELAWHFAQAGEPERALPYSIQAGDMAETVFAHAEGERHYRTALELARQLHDLRREAQVLHKLGAVLRIIGRYEEAIVALERAAELYVGAGDFEGEARLMHDVALTHDNRGSPEQGITRVHAVTERLERLLGAAVSPGAAAELCAALACCLWRGARYTEALAAAERAKELARAAKAIRTLGIAQTMRGLPLTMIGALTDARRVLEEAIPLLEKDDPWWLAQPWCSIGRAHVDEGDLQQGLRCMEQAHGLVEATHDQAELSWIVGNLGEVWYLRGDWRTAQRAYDRATQMARNVGADRYLSYVLLHRAELSSTVGDWDQANRDIDEGLEAASRCAAVPALRKGQRLLAERDVAQGHAELAVKRLQPLLESATGAWPRAFPPPVLSEAYLALGDVVRATELTNERVQRFRDHSHRRALTLWLPVQAKIRRRQGQTGEAQRLLQEAISLAKSMPYPYAEARAHYELAELLAETGQVHATQEELRHALAIFQRLGAKIARERTESKLARHA